MTPSIRPPAVSTASDHSLTRVEETSAMCLAVPGRVVAWINRDLLFASAEVEFEGIRRVCHMACVPEAQPGDFVIVHAGVAISRVDEAEAVKTLKDLRSCGDEPLSEGDHHPVNDAHGDPSPMAGLP